jgi:hypothetical protein
MTELYTICLYRPQPARCEMSRRRGPNAIVLAAIILALAALVYVAVGCANTPKPVVDPTPKLVAALTVIKSEAAQIHTEHAAAKTDLDTAVKLTTQPAVSKAVTSAANHVTLAEGHTVNVDKAVVTENAAVVQEGKDSVAVQTDRNSLQEYQKAHADDWLGPRAHRWLNWIIVLVVLFGIGYIVTAIIAATHPNVGGAVHVLLTIFTGAAHGVIYAFIWLGHFFRHGEATSLASGVTTPPKAATAPLLVTPALPATIAPATT